MGIEDRVDLIYPGGGQYTVRISNLPPGQVTMTAGAMTITVPISWLVTVAPQHHECRMP